MSVLSIALVRTKIFAYSECSFTTVSNCSQLFSVCSDLTGKILVFWIDGRLRQVVSHRGYLFTVFIYQLFWTQAFPEGMYTNGTQVPCEVPSALNPTTRKGWPHHRGLRPLLFSNSDVGSFTSHQNKSLKVLWDGTYGFSSLSEKTRKSNHLQLSLQRQHFLLSYLKTLSQCWSGRGLNSRPPAR